MQLSSLFKLALFTAAVSADTVSYDQGYDDRSRSLTQVSCSDGVNGLMTKHPSWKTQGDVSGFPNIGGVAAVKGWNSTSCGTCWSLQYNTNTIYVLAVDHADSGFNIAHEAMDTLTGGLATQLGRVDAKAALVAGSKCGL